MQENYTDLDIYRQKPAIFKSGRFALVVTPVRLKEHDIFLNDMATLIYDNFHMLKNLEFISAFDYSEKEAMKKMLDHVLLFQLNEPYHYRKFKNDAMAFINRWAYTIKLPKHISNDKMYSTRTKLKRSKRKCRKIINNMTPDTFIKILFLLFVYNFDLVKKNTLEFLKMFQISEETETMKQGISSSGSKKKEDQMPKFSTKPFSKSTLSLLEKQSKTN